jgi:aarF domain-containing kinase
MQENLPKELDFRVEASHALRLAELFKDDTTLKVPDVYSADERVMVMEFIHGARIDDRGYLERNRIDPLIVSHRFQDIFSRMIFVEGFVHADPHPGNVLIRSVDRKGRGENFEIVLLDHGLYRELSPRFRAGYAGLWSALIRGDEPAIEYASATLFSMAREDELARRQAKGENVSMADVEREQGEGRVPSYKLFASVLTGRPWSVVVLDGGGKEEVEDYLRERGEAPKPAPVKSKAGSGLTQARSSREKEIVAGVAGTGEFLFDVADILAKVPRELVLLLKTNDLLRAVDEDLGIGKGEGEELQRMQEHMVRLVTRMGFWVARCLYETRRAEFVEHEGGGVRGLVRRWMSSEMRRARWEYWSVWVRLLVAEMWLSLKGVVGM